MADGRKTRGTKWIVDTDCGVDDAQALMIALKYLDVVAITTVSGSVDAA